MANLKATTFEALEQFGEGKLGHNTHCRWNGVDGFIVTLHYSDIVKVFSDRVEFTLAGWNTVTTRERVNQFLPRGAGVSTVKFEPVLTRWDVDSPNDRTTEHISDTQWYVVPTA